MKSLMLFLHSILSELGIRCRTSTTADYKTICRRVEHEGLSFLTITLPDFGKDFEKSLDQGKVDRSLFQGFAWRGGLPRFLGGFLDLVFDRGTGLLLDDPDIEAIFAIRQITGLFAKIALPCSDARVDLALKKYVETEAEVRESDRRWSASQQERFHRLGRLLWANVFSMVDSRVYDGDVLPKHGPGATADKLRGNSKWNQQEWTHRLEQVFPHMEFLATSWSLSLDRLAGVTIREPRDERPVRVITVPKTLKTPRIIAIEPAAMQYMQQAILNALVDAIEADDLASKLIGFSSQRPNQALAEQGSRNGSLATLDLSEASDRVSNQHVRLLLRNHPHLFGAVDATRSRKADVPGKGVLRLAKFASMGSALCFPFEAMVFTTVIFMGIERELGKPLTRKGIKSFLGQVRVYGDDIIVPVHFVRSVVEELEAFGFRVNLGKSFWTGKFRESCGKEYYDGHDVSITRVRRVFPTQRRHVPELMSLVSLRNQLYMSGLWQTCRLLDGWIEGLIPFPIVEPTSSVLGRHSVCFDYVGDTWSDDLQRPLVRGARVVAKIPISRLDDYGALLKCLLMLERRSPGITCEMTNEYSALPGTVSDHLERAGRPQAVDIKLGLASPY
jgi:hypothetical protein